MQRGVINIQPKLVQIIQAQTAEIADHHPHTWEKLIDAALQTTKTTSLDLNKEEAEMILDLLPVPVASEPEELKQARLAIITLLQALK